MSVASEPPVTSAQVEEFRLHGVTVLRDLFGDWIDTLRRGVERNLADPGPYTKGYTKYGGPGNEEHFRLCFAQSHQRLTEALRRIVTYIDDRE